MQPFMAVALALAAGVTGLPKVAVLDLQTSGIDPSHAPLLTEVITTEFDGLGLFEVISGDDVRAMLGHEAQLQMMGCEDTGCLAEIGGALGADLILAARVGRLGESYVLTVKLVNVRSARTEARIYDTAEGEIGALVDLIRRSIRKLGREVRDTAKRAAAEAAREDADPQVAEAPAPDATPATGLDAPATGTDAATADGRAAAEGAGDDETGAAGTMPSDTAADDGSAEDTDVLARRDPAPAGAFDVAPASAARRGPGPGVISLWAVGGLGLGAGAFFALDAGRIHDEVTREDFQGPQTLIGQGQLSEQRANLSFAVGGGALAAGLVWWLLEPGNEPAVVLVPSLGPAPGAAAVVNW